MGFLEDVWSRNFLNFFATPLRISEYLAGLVITSILTSAIGLLVMLLSTLPGWMQVSAHILPPSYIFEGLRGLVRGEPLNFSALGGVGLALVMGYIPGAATFFKYVYQRAVRTGLVARYSAETLS